MRRDLHETGVQEKNGASAERGINMEQGYKKKRSFFMDMVQDWPKGWFTHHASISISARKSMWLALLRFTHTFSCAYACVACVNQPLYNKSHPVSCLSQLLWSVSHVLGGGGRGRFAMENDLYPANYVLTVTMCGDWILIYFHQFERSQCHT